MKRFAFLFLLCALHANAQERYSKIVIPLGGAVTIETVARLGVPLEEARVKPGSSMEVWASEGEQRILREQGIAFRVLVPDWDAQYAARLRADRLPSMQSFAASDVKHFHLGSMGGHLTFDEVLEELDAMRAAAPSLLSKNDTIGTTLQGRPVIAVRLSASADTALPQVLYTGLHHAREPEGMMALVYFMWYLIEQYPSNPEIEKLLRHAALHFVLVVNPDGYEYNRSYKPLGGGMWRKNRRQYGQAIGVDLNRNYGYQWGYDNIGSSADSTRETYRGPAPFSERESIALRDYCNAHRFRAALNYHTFDNLLIYPWGYSDKDTKDSIAYRELSERLTTFNRYTWGTGRQTVNYITNGDADDWMYGDTTAHSRMLSFTPEIGNSIDNFWASPSRILPLAAENLEANLQLAHAVTPHVRIASAVMNEDVDRVTVALTFTGNAGSPSIDTVRVSSASAALTAPGPLARVPFPSAQPVELRFDKVASKLAGGERVRVDVTIVTAESVMRDSVIFRIGGAKTLFADGAEAVNSAWIPDGAWGRQACEKARGGYCYTESPSGNYRDEESSSLTLRQPLDLRAYTAAELRFATRWRIESNSDYGTVEASSDEGATWTPLEGRYTSKAFGAQKQLPVDAPGYDGYRSTWASESMDLTPYCGKNNVGLRFNFESDEGAVFDGWLVDSIAVLAWEAEITGAENAEALPGFSLSQNSPNPFRGSTQLLYSLPSAAHVRITVRDVLGRVVELLEDADREAGRYAVVVGGAAPAGTYLCVLEGVRSGSGGNVLVAMRRMVKVE